MSLTDRETDEAPPVWNGGVIGSLSGHSFYRRLSDSSNLRDPPPSDLSAPSVAVTGEGQEAGWGGAGWGEGVGRRVPPNAADQGSAAFAVFTGDKQTVGEREFKAGPDRSGKNNKSSRMRVHTCMFGENYRTAP